MPGAVILINAMESLRVYGQLSAFSEIVEKGVGVTIVFLVWIGLEALRIELGPFVMYLMGYLPALMFSAVAILYFGVWFSVSGVVAGGLAHLVYKLFKNILDDIRKDPQHKLRNLLAPEFRDPR